VKTFRRDTGRVLAMKTMLGLEVSIAISVAGAWREVLASAGDPDSWTIAWEKSGPLMDGRIRRADGVPFSPEQIKVTVSLPLLNYAHVVVPDCGRHYVGLSKALDIRAPLYRVTASNAGHPFLAVADEGGDFLAAFGVVSPTGETEIRRVLPRISRRKAMVGGDQVLSLAIVWSHHRGAVEELPVSLYVQERAQTWVHALREYGAAVRSAEGIEYPVQDDAWNPTWCTWTAACSSEMDDRRVMDNARVARDLGIRTVILDDGWFGVGLDDDDGVLNVGDYAPDPKRFPDLGRLVGQLHELGLKVLLWHAPLCVAPTSQAYSRLRPWLIHRDGHEFVSVNGLAMLCPSSPEVRQYVADETVRLMKSWGVDGIKADLYNCLPVGPCVSTAHSHDIADPVAAVEAVMAVQWDAARSVRPDALIELKQDYGNVRLARYGTMVRAGDTAYDVDTNCRRCFYVQAYAPCVHNDYYVTSDRTEPRAVALAMIRMLTAGVPTFGNDLSTMPDPLRKVVRAWLDFYGANVDMFRLPRGPQGNDLSAWDGGDAERAWIAAIRQCRELCLPQAERVFVLNGTARDELYLRLPDARTVRAHIRDLNGESVRSLDLTLVDGCRLDVPSGGMADLASR